MVVIGGTGAFGERLSHGIGRDGRFAVTMAARGLARAATVAEAINRETRQARATAVRLDAATITAEELRALRPWAVVDASGPFVAGNWGVARAALGAGAHYLDLADGRDLCAHSRPLWTQRPGQPGGLRSRGQVPPRR